MSLSTLYWCFTFMLTSLWMVTPVSGHSSQRPNLLKALLMVGSLCFRANVKAQDWVNNQEIFLSEE